MIQKGAIRLRPVMKDVKFTPLHLPPNPSKEDLGVCGTSKPASNGERGGKKDRNEFVCVRVFEVYHVPTRSAWIEERLRVAVVVAFLKGFTPVHLF